jgi:hypothetical protein
MIAASRTHLAAAGETYLEHLRFAAAVGLMAVGAGLACMIHALVPALCQRTCSTTIASLQELFADRTRLGTITRRSSGPMTFSGLLALALAVGLLPMIAGVAVPLGLGILAVALAIPGAFLLTNTELGPV